MDSVIQFRGTIYEEGYGLLARKIVRDTRLPKQSRWIYAYMCSFASVNNDGKRSAFPSISLQCKELGMTEGTYYRWRKPLIDGGYITIEKQKDKEGKYCNNIYYIESVIYENNSNVEKKEKKKDEQPKKQPDEKAEKTSHESVKNKEVESKKDDQKGKKYPYSKNVSMDKPYFKNQSMENPYFKNRSMENPSVENSSTNSKSIKSKSYNINNNKNHYLNHVEVIHDLDIPQRLKQKIMVKIKDSSIALTINQLFKLENAYQYHIQQSTVIKDCSYEYVEALNDFEFTNCVMKALEDVEGINNINGLIKHYVLNAISFKRENYMGSEVEYNPVNDTYYDWMQD